MFVCMLCIPGLAGCPGSGDGGGADAQDLYSESRTSSDGSGDEGAGCVEFKVVGQPCSDACECMGGICALNEYAPFRFCTRPCGGASPGEYCEPEEGEEEFSALCVEFPAEFLVPPSRFCAPLCTELLDCTKLGAPYEDCEPAHWKGNPLYAALPDKICMASSAQGHAPVDPDTCEGWEGLFNEFAEERFACIGYCEYLDACKLLPQKELLDCCAFACMNQMVPDGDVDKDYFQYVRCYFDAYQAFSGTALVCTQPVDICGADPAIP